MTTPKIALGAWAWGNDGTFGTNFTEKDLRPIFDAAMKSGLNLWDTAYVYGMGTSEEVLGKFLRSVPRESYLISTKFTPQCANPEAENAVIEMYEGSVKRLGTDFMDFYWIHNPVGAPEWTRKLIPLAKTGKIGKIGLSNHNLAEIKEAAGILGAEGLKISAIQNHYSLLNRSSETSGILDWCKNNGATFFSYMVLEQGALSGKYDTAHPFPAESARGQVYNPVLSQIEKLNSAMKKIADSHSVEVAQLPVVWAIAKGTLPILGVTKV
ncbi:MAG: aldo/keto reductase, partial [Synergistaceae bacterium]|nr:aldo/keto reductase [Synergistaceae bacterium]